jgi:hypothetical protein
MTEEWRPVPSYDGVYEVSERGRVRRGDRLRAIYIAKNGYPSVNLWRHNKGRTHCVHWLVAEVFLGPKPEGRQINHRDGNKTNNNPNNLEYVTARGNSDHAIANGLTNNRGEQHGMTRMTNAQVRTVAEHIISNPKESYTTIGKTLGAHPQAVHRIATRQGWRSVTGDLVDELTHSHEQRTHARKTRKEHADDIRRDVSEGMTRTAAAHKYGISLRTVYRVMGSD